MQSRTSFFNRTLFRKNLTRFWPMWAVASLGGALFPLAMLVQLFRRPDMVDHALEFTETYYNVLAYGVPIISLCYAVLCAVAVWSYLYNARSVGLMHTLPIRREGVFVTNFVSGIVMMAIPYAVTGALCAIISIAFGFFDPMGLLVTILGVLGESFFYFSTATLAAFCVGNVFALPVVYFLLHFLAVLLDWLLSTFAEGFLFGLTGNYSGAVEWLSPTVYLMRRIRVNSVYEQIPDPYTEELSYIRGDLVSVSLENAWLIAAYAAVGVGCVLLAYMLYRQRRSESAGDVVAVGWMKPLFRYGATVLAALAGGLLLYQVFWASFQNGRYYDTIPMLVCMVIAGLLGYYAASMLLSKSFRVFRGSVRGCVLVVTGCVALCGILRMDLLNVSGRVPKIADIQMLEFRAASNTYVFYPGEEDDLLEQVRSIHTAIIADDKYYMWMEENWQHQPIPMDNGDLNSASVRFTYMLRNGKTLSRRYTLYLDRQRMEQSETADHALNMLINSAAMKEKRLHLGDVRYELSGGYLRLEKRNHGFDLNSREAAAVLEAVGRDLSEGTWGTYDWFEQNQADQYAMDLSLYFEYERFGTAGGDVRRTYSDHIGITLRPGMTHTIACLKQLGLLEESDLVTNRELYPNAYADEVTYYKDPTYETASIGGGMTATAVVVTG